MSLVRTRSKNIIDIFDHFDNSENSILLRYSLSKPKNATKIAELLEEDVYGKKSPLRPYIYDKTTKVNYLLNDNNGPITPYKASGMNVSFIEIELPNYNKSQNLITILRNKRIKAEKERDVHYANIQKWNYQLKKVNFEIQNIKKLI